MTAKLIQLVFIFPFLFAGGAFARQAGSVRALWVPQGQDPYSTKQTALQEMHLDEAMALLLDEKTRNSEDVLIGVIDKGPVERNHPDLLDAILPESEILKVDKREWHGQYVTGILAARSFNDVGLRGAIGIKSKIIYRQVHTADDIIFSINKLVARGVAVINMSLGLNEPCAEPPEFGQTSCQEPLLSSARIASAIENAARNSNTVMVISAGNDRQRINPFTAERDGVIIVGSINEKGEIAHYSNHGPGVSLYAADDGVWGLTNDGYLRRDPATSFTTPLVSAAAAWSALYLRAHDVNYTPRDIKNLILNSVQVQKNLVGEAEAPGRLDYLNLARALQNYAAHPDQHLARRSFKSIHR
jgi:subtilisin family serine protease